MKKNDKIFIIVIMGIAFCLLSWMISTGTFADGAFSSSQINKAGIFDYFLIFYYTLYYNCTDIFYLMVLGGTYGVLSQTKSYRKLVSKTASLIGGKENWVMLLVTLLMAVFVSFTDNVLAALIFVPFIITVFLKRGKDKITAINAAFGGIVIGLIGQTVGTFGLGQIMDATDIATSDGIVAKAVVLVVAYVLFNLFAILHMKKQKLVNDTKSDPFTTEKLDESSKAKKVKVWPAIVVFVIAGIVSILGYINWSDSFGVTIFQDLYTKISNSLVSSIAGSFSAFGYWSDALPLAFIIFVVSVIFAIIDKMNINKYLEEFRNGIHKSSKAVLGYYLALTIFITSYFFNWPITIINYLLGDGTFNMISILIVGIVGGLFYVDYNYLGYTLGSHLAIVHADNLVKSTAMLHMGWALSTVLVPSSSLLIYFLSYLDVKYVDWLKYIWKFVLSMFIAILIICAIAL